MFWVCFGLLKFHILQNLKNWYNTCIRYSEHINCQEDLNICFWYHIFVVFGKKYCCYNSYYWYVLTNHWKDFMTCNNVYDSGYCLNIFLYDPVKHLLWRFSIFSYQSHLAYSFSKLRINLRGKKIGFLNASIWRPLTCMIF